MSVALSVSWIPICRYEELVPDRGVAALVGDQQVAIFRTGDDAVYAVSNCDPFSQAQVMSRGIIGSRGETPVVSSPMYKQAFDLRSGRAIDDETVTVPVWPVRVVSGVVEVGI